MKIEISENGSVIWMRDSANGEGIMSTNDMKDGTQQKIIAALEEALLQAKGQYSVYGNKRTEKLAEAIIKNAIMNNCSRQQHS